MNLEETSMNFDSENVKPFLERLKPIIESGFSDEEINQVTKIVESLELDEEKELEFTILYKGDDTVLRIGIFMDDIEAPDLYFFTHPELVEEINEQFADLAEQLGI